MTAQMWQICHIWATVRLSCSAFCSFTTISLRDCPRFFAAALLLEQRQRLARDSRPLPHRQMTAMISVTPTKRVSTTSVTGAAALATTTASVVVGAGSAATGCAAMASPSVGSRSGVPFGTPDISRCTVPRPAPVAAAMARTLSPASRSEHTTSAMASWSAGPRSGSRLVHLHSNFSTTVDSGLVQVTQVVDASNLGQRKLAYAQLPAASYRSAVVAESTATRGRKRPATAASAASRSARPSRAATAGSSE
ncbi:hypothetical protein JMUB5695_01141 [Mycobacterium heckeshornense]|nr:hypothetical protein JMUB5695_01141 [Mycobacterium heckeshornense]